MSILKVEVGKPVTIQVDGCEEAEGNFGPQLKFTAKNGDVLFVGKDTGLRQLDRFGMTPDTAAGHALLFEKVAKGNKTFLNINPAPGTTEWALATPNGAKQSSGAAEGNGGAVAAPRAASAAPQSQPAAPNGHELYGKITAWVLREIVPMYEAGGVPMNAEAAAACVATLYIQANKNGH